MSLFLFTVDHWWNKGGCSIVHGIKLNYNLQNLWDGTKEILIAKFIAMTAYVKKNLRDLK